MPSEPEKSVTRTMRPWSETLPHVENILNLYRGKGRGIETFNSAANYALLILAGVPEEKAMEIAKRHAYERHKEDDDE